MDTTTIERHDTLREFTLDLPNGVSLSGAERGDPGGAPLILIHGYSDSWRSYAPVMAELPAHVRAIALTLRGHGDSSKPREDYSMAAFAGDIAAAMDQLAIRRAAIAGHSMGSLVAQTLALDYASRVESLVLIGAFPTVKGNPGAEEMWRDAIAPMAGAADPAFIRMFQESTLARPVPAAFLETVIAESGKAPVHVWQGALRAMLAEDRSSELHRISVPTLILWGDQDAFCSRADQDFMTRAIKSARLVVYEGGGHDPHWENPESAAADILSMIRANGDA